MPGMATHEAITRRGTRIEYEKLHCTAIRVADLLS